MNNAEQSDLILKLKEGFEYYKAYSKSLKRELKEKDQTIESLTNKVNQLSQLFEREKGDLKSFKKDKYVQELVDKVNKLTKENDKLIAKIGFNNINEILQSKLNQ